MRAPYHPGLRLPRLPYEHSLLGPVVSGFFDELGVSVTLLDARNWHPIHEVPNVLSFELEHGVENPRIGYNDRCMKEVLRRRTTVQGTYAGFCDLFTPVVRQGKVCGILVAGPFGTAPPTRGEILDRWRGLTARHGHLSDPEFASYVSMTLATVVFEGRCLRTFKSLMTCFAQLMSGEGDAERVLARAERARKDLREVTFVLRMWEAARTMIDPRTGRILASEQREPHRLALGITRVPQFAVVGLIAGDKDGSDPVDSLLRRYAFQRACVRLARAHGDVACGRVGDHGVSFLLPPERTDNRTRAALTRIGERAVQLARQTFQLRLHLGVGPVTREGALPARHQAALTAAEEALSRGASVVLASSNGERPAHVLRNLRRQLGQLVREPPSSIAARFDRYLEVVAAHSGYRLDLARAHLESGFERLVEPFLASGALDRKGFDGLCAALDRETETIATVSDLFSAYRRVVLDLQQALLQPAHAHKERNLRRSVAFIHEHLSEPITLSQVARVAGFAPTYFSRLFKERERATFARYIQDLRIERAGELLTRTPLSIDRVRQLAGFSSAQYFHRVFKRSMGETPFVYRSSGPRLNRGDQDAKPTALPRGTK
jgi:AraC-like DNA-binding protein